MCRCVLIVGALLAAGAVLNTGVALALFATGDLIRIHRTTHYDLVSGTQHVRRGTTCTINNIPATNDRLPPFLHPEGEISGWQARITRGRWVGDASMGGVRSATGWPLPALRHVPPPIGSVAPPAPGAPPPKWFAMTHGRMPRHIYWPGFAANTLLIAAALTPLLALYPLRSAVRARRGRCPRCGYDIRGLHTCPECGAPRPRIAPTAVEGDAR